MSSFIVLNKMNIKYNALLDNSWEFPLFINLSIGRTIYKRMQFLTKNASC